MKIDDIFADFTNNIDTWSSGREDLRLHAQTSFLAGAVAVIKSLNGTAPPTAEALHELHQWTKRQLSSVVQQMQHMDMLQ